MIYLPALALFIAFNTYHYSEKGWIGYHEDSPWAACFQPVGLKGILRNFVVVIWRILDFGRVFLIFGAFVILLMYFKKIKSDSKFIRIILISAIVLITLSITALIYTNLSGHRYLLPIFLSFSLLTCYLVFEVLKNDKTKKIVFAIMLAGLLSGNLWIYPVKISVGWDSTLAHLHYYKLRKDMLKYFNENKIKIEDVSCAFPNIAEQKYLELNDDIRKHKNKNLDTDELVLFSNVYNDFSDEEIDKLKSDFTLIVSYKQMGVFMDLYKRKDKDPEGF